MSEILLKAAEARQASLDMQKARTAATEQVQTVRNKLNELQSSFKGKTATAFDAKFEEWRKGSEQLLASLDGLANFLKTAADAIEKVDNEIAGKLNG